MTISGTTCASHGARQQRAVSGPDRDDRGPCHGAARSDPRDRTGMWYRWTVALSVRGSDPLASPVLHAGEVRTRRRPQRRARGFERRPEPGASTACRGRLRENTGPGHERPRSLPAIRSAGYTFAIRMALVDLSTFT